MLDTVAGAIGSVSILLGLTLATIGLYGMLRHPDVFEQLHAAGLVTGPSVILVLVAALGSGRAEIMTSAFLVVVFILVTSSLSTHVVALSAWRQREASGEAGGAGGAGADADASARAPMRVLLPHDGSPASDVAIELASSLAWPDGCRVTVIGVTEGDLPPISDIDRPPASAPVDSNEPAVAVGAAAGALERPGLDVAHVLRGGDPATVILDEADAVQAELIVMGSRGLGAVESMLTGSVASGVLDQAPCPVLVARSPSLRSVLVATDGSEASAAAIEVVARWSIFDGLEIQVLSVAALADHHRELSPIRAWREAAERSRNRRVADAAAVTLETAGRRSVPHVVVGDRPAASVVDFAHTHAIDLIVLGTRGRTGLTRTLLGSVARDVVVATEASVLVVRSGQ
jgi:monovalent cation/proton antiporter MnhG/PhaG subunit